MDPQEEFILAGLVYMFFVTVLYFMERGARVWGARCGW